MDVMAISQEIEAIKCQIEELNDRVEKKQQQICTAVGHKWHLSQIAGDGYTCLRCNAWRGEDSDEHSDSTQEAKSGGLK